jgi:hypothetical protein
MADWEAELTTLLRALDVSLERDSLSASHGAAEHNGRSDLEPVDDLEPAEMGSLSTDLVGDQSTVDVDEVSAVRHEIEATLARVVQLTDTGQLDRALRDDVLFVLQALTRPRPSPPALAERDEWQLASAAAVLHFCRVVLRLTRPLDPEGQI